MGLCRNVFYSPDSFFVNAPDDGYMRLSSATLLGVGAHSLLFNIMFLLLDLMFPLFFSFTVTRTSLPPVLTSDFLHESNVSFQN